MKLGMKYWALQDLQDPHESKLKHCCLSFRGRTEGQGCAWGDTTSVSGSTSYLKTPIWALLAYSEKFRSLTAP